MKDETPGIDDLRGCEFVGSALFFFLGCVGWGGGLMLPTVLAPVTTARAVFSKNMRLPSELCMSLLT